MSRILFPTDLSDISANVLPSARNLAELLGGELTVLHAYKEQSRLRSFLQPQKQKRTAWNKLADFCSVEDGTIPSNFSLRLRPGNPVEAIVDASQYGQFRYIAMGRKHSYENFRKLTGDKTGQVLSSAFCPTIVLPENRPVAGIRNILIFGANYRHTDSIVQQDLLLLSMTTGANLHYLDLHHNPTEWEHHKELLHGQSFLVQKIVPQDYALESAMEYIEDQQIDLLVMLGKRRNLFESLFEYGVEHNKLDLVNIPLLVFHPHYLGWKHNQLKMAKQLVQATAAV